MTLTIKRVTKMINKEAIQQQAAELKLHGLLARWHELSEDAYVWLQQLIDWEQKRASATVIRTPTDQCQTGSV